MTAISIDKNRRYIGDLEGHLSQAIPVAASTKIPAGALTSVNSSGNAVNGRATSTDKVLGVNEVEVDNSAGSAGDKSTSRIARGTFLFANSASSDLIAAKDIGAWCYVVDNDTVALTDNSGARPKAGRIAGVDSSGVWVEVGMHPV